MLLNYHKFIIFYLPIFGFLPMSLARLQNKIVLLPHSRAYTRTHTPALYVLLGLSEGQFETSVGSIDLEGEKKFHKTL